MLRLPNQILIVDINIKDKARHFVVPMPLFIVDDLLEGWWFWRIVLRWGLKKAPVESLRIRGVDMATLSAMGVASVRQMWHQIRKAGRFELVDISAQGFSLKIKFY